MHRYEVFEAFFSLSIQNRSKIDPDSGRSLLPLAPVGAAVAARLRREVSTIGPRPAGLSSPARTVAARAHGGDRDASVCACANIHNNLEGQAVDGAWVP